MTARAAITTATRIEALRERIARDAPDITRRIREAAEANLGNEARFRTLFAQIIEPWAQLLDIPLLVREERTLATGRADATYNRMVIEYEAPGRLRDNIEHGATAHAIQQAKDYVEGVASEERQQVHRLIGVAIDGFYFIYVRKVEGHWTDPEVEPVNEQSVARFLRLLVSLTSGKALLPENLVQDFGSNTLTSQRIASSLYQSLARVLDDGQVDIVDKLFEQWQTFFGEVTGYEEGATPLRNRPELRQFARGMGLDVQNVDPPRLFFTVHTYFALLIKLIAYYALSRFVSGFGTRFGSMYQLNDDDLKREMEELERGGIFRTLGIRNFLEGDFFKWYLYTWDASVAQAVRTLLDRLKDYDPGTLEVSPEQARDLLKKLYHRLMPREIRHDLGEYYTPDWLAEHVLNELGYEGQPDKRLLDPACGSGTFLVLAIKRLRERCFREGMNEQETLETILKNVVGIDLNPLAAIAARTNYLLALGDLLVHRTREIDVPVYLADSILTPAAGEQLFSQDRYEITTAVGQFDIPSCLKTQEQINKLRNLLEECVTSEAEVDVFLERANEALALADGDWEGGVGRGDGAGAILRALFNKLADLHEDDLDGIWARILQNAFMPLFLGKFDLITGNPPWVNWRSLPESYRQATTRVWARYALFQHRGFQAILGSSNDDISVLMSYTVSDALLKPDGHLGFVITQTVFKSMGAGQGFRRLRINEQTPLGIQSVHDFSDFQPFESATNRTAVFTWRKGGTTSYPVPYWMWQKTIRRATISQDASLAEVRGLTRRLEFSAEPVDPSDSSSPWITGRRDSIDAIRNLIRPSGYRARVGAYTGGANAVYWLTVVHHRPDGLPVVQNLREGARRQVESVTAEIEAELVYPLLRGRDVQKWRAAPSASILVTHSPAGGLTAYTTAHMQRQFPRAYAYLRRFEEMLRGRAVFRRYFTRRSHGRIVETGPYYSMFDIGPYTFASSKVVWREQAAEFTVAAVVSTDRPIVPDHKLMVVETASATEAYYLAGVLGNSISRYIVASYILNISTSTAILENLAVPEYDARDRRHQTISECCRQLHIAAGTERSCEELEAELDGHVAGLMGITDEQLTGICESYRELTKADLRDAREAENADNADDEAEDADATNGSARVFAALDGNGEMTAAEIATVAGIEADELRPLLRQLVGTDRIEQIGQGRGTRYKLAGGQEA
ncbi:MAG: SAM-dependent methyltransferase [Phycisphaerae bacterium]|nr:MAG: SAM-dependent methyltransferase [Phycisphaerae bacterium]